MYLFLAIIIGVYRDFCLVSIKTTYSFILLCFLGTLVILVGVSGMQQLPAILYTNNVLTES